MNRKVAPALHTPRKTPIRLFPHFRLRPSPCSLYRAAVFRLVLFDIDGTLIRTGGAGMMAFARTFKMEFKVDQATEGVSFAGRTDTGLLRECFNVHRIPANAANYRRFFDTYVFLLEQLLQELNGHTCPGIREFISEFESLPDAPLLGLLTGNIRLGAEIKLRHYGLWDHFRSGAFGDDHEDRNHLATVAMARGSQLLGRPLKGKEILVIGDTPLDIECARAIDARVLAVGTGAFTSDQLREHHPTWLAPSLEGITLDSLSG